MRAVELIAAKRRGAAHRKGEISALIAAYMRDEVPDYQIAAWLMAVCWQGLDTEETTELTLALANSGRRLRFDGYDRPVVDKHSTGGVGDKTTLVLTPMLVAAGAAVAKMSGRGLGHTGGTVDKLEAIPGVRATTDPDALVAAVKQDGIAVAAQSPDLAPADGRLYALRDVTATVESIPLIATSVMSKKIATGANAVVLDVKAGSGAFMKEADSARALARAMVALGRGTELPTVAVISSMEAPLGRAIGNALEVREAVETLRGGGPADLVELCVELGAEVLAAARVSGHDDARASLRRTLEDNSALEVFRRLVSAMGGDPRCVDDLDMLPRASYVSTVAAAADGYVVGIDALRCGEVAMRLGAGRAKKGDAIDPAAGLVLRVAPGARVRRDDPLVEVHARQEAPVDLVDSLRAAFSIQERAPGRSPLILDVIR